MKSSSRLGQSSIEFLSLIAMSSLLLAGLYGLMAAKKQETFEYRNDFTAREVSEKVSFQVEMATVQGDGYSRVFSVPAEIAGEHYNVTIRDRNSIVEWGNNTIIRSTLYNQSRIDVQTSKSNILRVTNNDGDISLKEVS